jgi:hypothetical protein
MRPSQFPAIGLDLIVHMSPSVRRSVLHHRNHQCAGEGPPRHKHTEAEIFRVLEGRYLYEKDGRRFYAESGDVVSIPGGAEHGFVNVTDKPARQYILIVPALDAASFFTELAGAMQNGVPDKAALNRFGAKWRVEFLGPPLTLADQPTT